MTDKDLELINDLIDKETTSVCCNAPLVNGICLDCKEHSGPSEPDEETNIITTQEDFEDTESQYVNERDDKLAFPQE